MFSSTLSPNSHSHTSRLMQSFTQDKSMLDLLKDELRQAIMREEEYKYQLNILEQQNQDLKQQKAEQLHNKIQSITTEASKYEEIAQVQKEKCEMMAQFQRPQRDIEECNALKQEVQRLKSLQQQLDDLNSQLKSVRLQCDELKESNRTLKATSDKALQDRDTLKKGLIAKDQEMSLLKQKLSKLEQLYTQKAESVDGYFEQAEAKYQSEKQFTNQLQEELRHVLQERQLMINAINDLKETHDNKSLQYCDMQCQLQQANILCEQLKRSEQKLLLENKQLKEHIEHLRCQVEASTIQIQEQIDNNNDLQKGMEILEQNHNQQITQMEEICYQYKRGCEQSKLAYNQCQSKYEKLLNQYEQIKDKSQVDQEEFKSRLRRAETTIEDLNQRLRDKQMKCSSAPEKESDMPSYYVGKNSSRTRYVTDQSELNSYRNNFDLKCRLQTRHSAQPTMQTIQAPLHRSKLSLDEGIDKQHSPVTWDPNQVQTIQLNPNETEQQQLYMGGGGTIKRREHTKPVLRASERNFVSLVQSCQTSHFNSQQQHEKENTVPFSTKTLDQLQQKYLNLRSRIHQK